MAQVHVIPFMERAKPAWNPPQSATSSPTVTTRSARRSGARGEYGRQGLQPGKSTTAPGPCFRRHQSQWDESPVVSAGERENRLSGRGGTGRSAALVANVQPGPQATPEAQRFHVTIGNNADARAIGIQPGGISIPIELTAGKNSISVTIEDPSVEKYLPMVMLAHDPAHETYGIEREHQALGLNLSQFNMLESVGRELLLPQRPFRLTFVPSLCF